MSSTRCVSECGFCINLVKVQCIVYRQRIMNKRLPFIFLSLVLFSLIFFSSTASCHAAKNLQFLDFYEADARDIISSMTIEEKIGQILIFGFQGYDLDAENTQWMSSGRLGNMKLFLRNVQSREQVRNLTDMIENLCAGTRFNIPPFVATDLEGGTVNHIRELHAAMVPSPGLLGAAGDPEFCRDSARLIALTLHDLGINMNFAPCADVLTNPDNRVIGTRSYGSDPFQVYGMVRAFIEEHRQLGILTTVKHFPGHGMTDFDSHRYSGIVDTPLNELQWVHIEPYRLLISQNLMDACMVSHIVYRQIDPLYSASFSTDVITGLLRNNLAYRGLVITDDLEMGGSRSYASDILKAFVFAFRAGNDLMLVSHDLENQKRIIENAAALFKNGILDEKELDQRVLRVLKMKKRYLVNFYVRQGSSIVRKRMIQEAQYRVESGTAQGITLISSKIGMFPPGYFFKVSLGGVKGLVLSPTSQFEELAKQYLPGWDIINIYYMPNRRRNQNRLAEVRKKLKNYDIVVIGLANELQAPWARACMEKEVPFAVLSVDNPYTAIPFVEDALFIAASYGPYSPSIEALFKAVFVTGEFPGRFPYLYSGGMDE